MLYYMNMEKLKTLQISEKFKSAADIPSWLNALGKWSSQLKLIRETLGMTQKQLAKRIKSSQITISRLESKDSNPTIETLNHIANALDCELMISFIPKKNIMQNIEDRAYKKAQKIVSQSVANAAMELQKPNKKLIKLNEEELKADLIKNKRELLW